MRTSGWLARLGGGQEALLAQAPGERMRFNSMGGVLLGSAGIAALSMAFGLTFALGSGWIAAAVVGLFWGLVILNLDRQLILGMTRGSVAHMTATVVPRVLIALLLGAVISMPLVLKIFEQEIDAKLRETSRVAVDAETKAINEGELTRKIDTQTELVAKLSTVEGDPQVARLTKLLEGGRPAFEQANEEISCEIDGTCSRSGPGRGPDFAERKRKFDILERDRNQQLADLATAKGAAQQRIDLERQDPNSQLSTADANLKSLNEQLRAQNDGLRDVQQNTGLSARMQALFALGDENAAVGLAHLALFLLFTLIEVLPVLAKLLTLWGPESLYDKLVKRQETQILKTDDMADGTDAEIAMIRRSVPVEIERHRAGEQIRAGQRQNEVLISKQEEMATRAIDLWGQVAVAQSDTELRRWANHQQSQSGYPSANGHAAHHPPATPGYDYEPPPEGVRDYGAPRPGA